MSKRAIFLGHLGLGDHIIQQGIVNGLAEKYEQVLMFAKHHNAHSVQHMCPANIYIMSVRDDTDVFQLYPDLAVNNDADIIKVGMYNDNWKYFDGAKTTFDRYFYTQAGVEFDQTYHSPLKDGNARMLWELDPKESFCFVHDDKSRSFAIDNNRLNTSLPVVRPTIHSNVIFDYLPLLRKATEIHCIDSSFALMIDRANDIKAKKYIHRYLRWDSNNPSYTDGWELLK